MGVNAEKRCYPHRASKIVDNLKNHVNMVDIWHFIAWCCYQIYNGERRWIGGKRNSKVD